MRELIDFGPLRVFRFSSGILDSVLHQLKGPLRLVHSNLFENPEDSAPSGIGRFFEFSFQSLPDAIQQF
jgi:hypothetical protein